MNEWKERKQIPDEVLSSFAVNEPVPQSLIDFFADVPTIEAIIRGRTPQGNDLFMVLVRTDDEKVIKDVMYKIEALKDTNDYQNIAFYLGTKGEKLN